MSLFSAISYRTDFQFVVCVRVAVLRAVMDAINQVLGWSGGRGVVAARDNPSSSLVGSTYVVCVAARVWSWNPVADC
jgi:hypothetical protein